MITSPGLTVWPTLSGAPWPTTAGTDWATILGRMCLANESLPRIFCADRRVSASSEEVLTTACSPVTSTARPHMAGFAPGDAGVAARLTSPASHAAHPWGRERVAAASRSGRGRWLRRRYFGWHGDCRRGWRRRWYGCLYRHFRSVLDQSAENPAASCYSSSEKDS